ncbi:MAG TPA: hypothetical protein VFU47_05425 [Armatimonadota bacterium]|nr:hypothetical protein [Armatimonadota bacterium]
MTTRRRRFRGWRWVLLALALLLPALAAGGLLAGRYAEDALLRGASAQVESGDLEAALRTLEPLKRQRFLSREGRRRAAALYFRLGEDKSGHALLAGIPFHEGDPEDARLRALAARCQRAASLLKKADAAASPRERLRLTRAARDELPDAPDVLLRVAEAELQAMLHSNDPAQSQAFEEAYTELRRKAPARAAELRRRVQQAVGTEKR